MIGALVIIRFSMLYLMGMQMIMFQLGFVAGILCDDYCKDCRKPMAWYSDAGSMPSEPNTPELRIIGYIII